MATHHSFIPIHFSRATTVERMKQADNEGSIKNGTFIWCDESERLYIYMKNKIIGITPAKHKIRKIACKSCGAPLRVEGSTSIVECKYCKSVYDIDYYDMEV